jgi:hypothetical protein
MTRPCTPPPAGAATIATGAGRRLTFHCDPSAHCVRVTDAAGRPQGTIGGPGLLDTPLDLVVIHPPAAGPRLPLAAPGTTWIAVADSGHRRVQVFETDGTPVAAIDLGDEPGLGAPCRLAWRAPVLEVEGLDGRRVVLYLAAALLASRQRPAGRSGAAPAPLSGREAVN